MLTLVGAIDDATGIVTAATFRKAEDAAGYLEVFRATIARYGRPLAVYSDQHGIFIKDANRPPTLAEQLAGKRSLTQVGRALDEAGIGWIGASSPQAKGRIERLWGTKQDRLTSELRRARASTIEEANVILARYLPRHNRWFAVEPADPEPAWQPWPDELELDAVFGFCYPRRVANDATLAWSGASLALPRRIDGRSWAGRTVTLEERLDGSLWVAADGCHQRLVEAPPWPRSCAPAGSNGSSRSCRHLSEPSMSLAHRRRPPRQPVRSTLGGGTLRSGHGDRVAVRYAVRIAVPRQGDCKELDATSSCMRRYAIVAPSLRQVTVGYRRRNRLVVQVPPRPASPPSRHRRPHRRRLRLKPRRFRRAVSRSLRFRRAVSRSLR